MASRKRVKPKGRARKQASPRPKRGQSRRPVRRARTKPKSGTATRKRVTPKRRVRKPSSRPKRSQSRRPVRRSRTEAKGGQRRAAGALRLMRRRGLSLAKAARTARVSPRTVRRVAGAALKKQPNDRYVARRRDRLVRVVYVLTDDGIREASLKGSEQATLVGEHWNTLHAYVARGESDGLRRFEGSSVTDVNGTVFILSTDLVAIERLANAGVLSFESIYARTR